MANEDSSSTRLPKCISEQETQKTSPTNKPRYEDDWKKMAADKQWVSALDFRDVKFRRINMWVEGIDATSARVVIHVAVRAWEGYGSATLATATNAYLVDDQGRTYNLEEENRLGVEPFLSAGEVRPLAIERVDLYFPPIKPTESLTLVHPQFNPLKIYKELPPVVYFCSPTGLFASSESAIFCDGQLVANLPEGQHTELQLKKGGHICGSRNSELIHLYLNSGDRYYVQVRNPIFGKLSLSLRSCEQSSSANPKLISGCMQ